MNDLEIKKALECCSTYHDVRSCKNCPLDGKCEPNLLEQYALDLINRKDQENENLKAEVERLKEIVNFVPARNSAKSPFLNMVLDNVRTEAYKEFAERLKAKYLDDDEIVNMAWVNAIEHIDNLLNELVGEDNESKA